MELIDFLQKLKAFFSLYINKHFTGELRVTVHLSQGGISKVKFGYDEVVK